MFEILSVKCKNLGVFFGGKKISCSQMILKYLKQSEKKKIRQRRPHHRF